MVEAFGLNLIGRDLSTFWTTSSSFKSWPRPMIVLVASSTFWKKLAMSSSYCILIHSYWLMYPWSFSLYTLGFPWYTFCNLSHIYFAYLQFINFTNSVSTSPSNNRSTTLALFSYLFPPCSSVKGEFGTSYSSRTLF